MSTKPIEIQIRRKFRSSKRKLFAKLLSMREFQTFMPNVKESKLLEVNGKSALMKWLVDVEGIPIQWTERVTFDRRSFRLTFQALDGDLDVFEGEWHVEGEDGHASLLLDVRFHTGIPLLQGLIGDSLKGMMTRNFESMLTAIERKLREEYYQSHLPKRKVGGYALIGHPYNYQHMLRYLHSLNPKMKMPSQDFLSKIFEMTPPHKSYDIAPIVSTTGASSRGHLIMCPIIPDMLDLNLEAVFHKVIEACRVAEDLRLGVVTLGGFTSVAGERFGREIPKLVSVPVTTGNTLTAALAIDGVFKGCERMGVDMERAKLAVIGGSGDIGSACARILAENVRHVTLVARNIERLLVEQGKIERLGKAEVSIGSDIEFAVKDADIVIAAASVTQSFLSPDSFKSGAVVCDIGYPKNISHCPTERDDILIFSGGLCTLPSEFDLGAEIDYGLPTKRVLYGCFAEAIVLDLERHYESFSVGRGNITKERVGAIRDMAHKHGFGLAPFFWGDRLLGVEEFATIRQRVRR
jgi:predicted amino acid dehydrogenase/ribosome-associated toxin RatA of RatAB toxin-antitoxin module